MAACYLLYYRAQQGRQGHTHGRNVHLVAVASYSVRNSSLFYSIHLLANDGPSLNPHKYIPVFGVRIGLISHWTLIRTFSPAFPSWLWKFCRIRQSFAIIILPSC